MQIQSKAIKLAKILREIKTRLAKYLYSDFDAKRDATKTNLVQYESIPKSLLILFFPFESF